MVHYWSPSCRCCCCDCSKSVLNKNTFIVMLMISNMWLGRGTACFVAGNVFQLPEMVCSSWSRTFNISQFCFWRSFLSINPTLLPYPMVFFRYPKVIIGAQKKWQQNMTHDAVIAIGCRAMSQPYGRSSRMAMRQRWTTMGRPRSLGEDMRYLYARNRKRPRKFRLGVFILSIDHSILWILLIPYECNNENIKESTF